MGLNLIVMLLIARSLGPKIFGELNYLLAIVALLAPLTALGLNSLVTKEVLDREHQSAQIMGTSIVIRIIGGILAFALVLVFINFSGIAHGSNFQLALLAFINIFTATYAIDFYMQAKMLNQSVVKLRLTVLFFINLTKIIGLWQSASLNFYLAIAALEMLLTGFGFILLYHFKTQQLTKLSVNFTEAKYLFKKSSWLILSGIAAIIYLKIDQIMLGTLSTSEQVGIYAVASRLSEVWYFIPTAIVISFFPKLIKLKDTPQYSTELQKLNDLLFTLAILVALPTTFFATPVIVLLFGNTYKEAGLVLSIHIWAGLFIFMRALLSKWLINENLLKFSLVTQLLGAVFNIVCNFYYIPIYGALGAAIATVISYATASYIALLFHHSTRPMAKIMTKSLLLPIRFIMSPKSLYKVQNRI